MRGLKNSMETPEEMIEYLKHKMVCVAEEKGSLTHPDVVAISQRLDLFLVQVQRSRLAAYTNPKRNVSFVRQTFKSGSKYPVPFRTRFVNHFTNYTIKHPRILH